MPGIFRRPGKRAKPFQIHVGLGRHRKLKSYATEREAVIGRLCHTIFKNVVRDAPRRALVEKRAHDVKKHGGQCAMERDCAVALVREWSLATGRDAIVLNDFTRADVLLATDCGVFLPVQIKTTGGSARTRNSYNFTSVGHYDGMPVVCWRCDRHDAWVFDGKALRGRSSLCVTPKGRIEALAMATALSMSDLVAFLIAHASQWPGVTEYAARHDFASPNHEKEMRGIDEFCRRFGGDFSWPQGQNTHVDLMHGDRRLQFKSVHPLKGKAGFQCNMNTAAGRDRKGKQLKRPYPFDAFDELIAVFIDDVGRVHFWRIPAAELHARGILSDAAHRGKQNMYVHGPLGVGRAPATTGFRRVDTWTQTYYVAPR